MAREIKFRAWFPLTNTMHSWNDIGWKEMNEEMSVHTLLNREYEHFNPMQYTGLKDRNGKGREMYEGDIYKQDSRHYVIEWSEQQCGFVTRSMQSRSVLPGYLQGEIAVYDDYEYIGSIYEHPNLLKE